MLKRILGVAFAVTMGIATPILAQTKPVTIRIVHFNDTDQMLPRDGAGGLAEAMTLIHHLRAEQPNTILTFGGDMFSPSLLSGFDKGAHMVALTGAMGIVAAAPGNHEFDFGPDNATARFKQSTYPWLSANILRNGRPLDGLSPSFVREIDGVKFGFFGVTTQRSADTTSAGPTVAFTDPVEAARREAGALRQQGAEIVIGLCHLEYVTELDLLRKAPAVDICLSGDDHVGFVFYDGRQLSLEAGSNLNYLGVLDLHVTRVKSGDREVLRWRPEARLVSTAGVAPDPEMARRVQAYTSQLDASLNVEIGKADGEFDSRRATVRTREAAFANLLADSMREATGADVAVINGGGIRADKLYPAGHTFTRRDILSELPFGNVTVVLRVTGAQLKAALENGVSQVEEAAGRFPQVSGITFYYDSKAKAGERVGAVAIGGKALDPNTTYKLATNDFMARGGDGYVSFRDAPRLIDEKAGKLMATTLIDHIAAKKTVKAATDGRIVAK
jgi:2',3'-cyclic-nucleotide 2'-phosphodiesterase (5'-nucleotidase family)